MLRPARRSWIAKVGGRVAKGAASLFAVCWAWNSLSMPGVGGEETLFVVVQFSSFIRMNLQMKAS